MSRWRFIKNKILRSLSWFFGMVLGICFTAIVLYIVIKGLIAAENVQLASEPSVILGTTGILPFLLNTLLALLLSLVISMPLGIGGAIFFHTIKKRTPLLNALFFLIDVWAATPSIVYALLGIILFSTVLGLGISLITATLSMALLLILHSFTITRRVLGETTDAVIRQAHTAGASHRQVLLTILLRNSGGGIAFVVLQSAIRVIGESTLFLACSGAGAMIANNLHAAFQQGGGTLSAMVFVYSWQYGDSETGFFISMLLLLIVFILSTAINNTLETRYKNKLVYPQHYFF